ncbi:hypothetical protein [Variovorax soli]|uniref:Uncharacterized protein n=1 Tax=Variovorax soli TaxID=376815 RepID=A0ABU1NE81_9BURK|nr:hypothetical protein [Variovorax soli]MDR6536757.1 hypothetical protein [Variovorax soli]
METSDMDFSFLGSLVAPAEAREIRAHLLRRLNSNFFPERSDALPIACRIEPLEQASELQEHWFSGIQAVIAYMENYDLMIRTTVPAVLKFLGAREPWQDFDVCIFDDEMNWCAALTHNDEAKFLKLQPNLEE